MKFEQDYKILPVRVLPDQVETIKGKLKYAILFGKVRKFVNEHAKLNFTDDDQKGCQVKK